jgi:dihydrofolate reductase
MISTLKPANIIVATDPWSTIGHGPKMPGWNVYDDFILNFVPKTKNCPVIMGRITAESLDGPLKGRTNILVTKDKNYKREGFKVVHSLEEAILLAEKSTGETIWIIGGGQIYDLALKTCVISEIHQTTIESSYRGDDEVKFPVFSFEKYIRDTSKTLFFAKRKPKTNNENDRGNSDAAIVNVYVNKNVA